MKLQPGNLFQTCEFEKIKELCLQFVMGPAGYERVASLAPLSDRRELQRLLQQLDESIQLRQLRSLLPIQEYQDIRQSVMHLQIEDYILTIQELLDIRNILTIFKDIHEYVHTIPLASLTAVPKLIEQVAYDITPYAALLKVLDVDGMVRSDASPELIQIRQSMQSCQRRVDKSFQTLLNKLRNSNPNYELGETIRNHRRVVSVPVEEKRNLKGIIHDESATGKTVFIEPEELIELNNELFHWQQEERREIHRILKALCNTLGKHSDYLLQVYKLIGILDFIKAKTLLAQEYQGNIPSMDEHQRMKIIQGRHPLLVIRNKSNHVPVIPFGLELHEDQRILLISGPNAGGKSILMKSVGLMQMMFQSGLAVSMDKDSSLPIFQHIAADIGDYQSIDDDLSTFSGRMQNMTQFLKHSGRKSLILIDEFGAGTDPKIGGALAEALLERFQSMGVYGVMTTHFSNLKVLAHQSSGIINGSMQFDQEKLIPTYQLILGQPGSSYALEIASKSNLPMEIINRAKKKVGKSNIALEDLLNKLQREQQEYHEKNIALTAAQEELYRMMKSYQQMFSELEVRRIKHKIERKEIALQKKAMELYTAEQVLKELRKEVDLKRAAELAEQKKQQQRELADEIHVLHSELLKSNDRDVTKELQVGDQVKLLSTGGTGVVLRIDKDQKVVVAMGALQVTFPRMDVVPMEESIYKQKQPGVQLNLISNAQLYSSKIDLRGMRKSDALQLLEEQLDNSLMSSIPVIEIIHGIGNGVLRKAVFQKCKEYKDIKRIWHPAPDQGGNGVTWISFQETPGPSAAQGEQP